VDTTQGVEEGVTQFILKIQEVEEAALILQEEEEGVAATHTQWITKYIQHRLCLLVMVMGTQLLMIKSDL
jgi:hypothetical protein